jgi:anti-sigma B factor antagonist
MNFAVNTEVVEDGIAVIDLKGEVDLYTAPEFKQHLLGQIEAGVLKIVIDFTDTTFIDSTTLGVLVGGVKRLRPVGGQLLLVCSDRNLIKIFEITGLHRVFEIYGTRDEALEAARAATPAG